VSAPRTLRQYAALPWRHAEAIEILLVTSRETRRWVIPKGWPIAGLAPDASAAQEAFEEAGVQGTVESSAIGVFHYVKRRKGRTARMCRVEVFALKVESEAQTWPELAERSRRWFTAEEAAAAVDEPELKALILSFGAAPRRS